MIPIRFKNIQAIHDIADNLISKMQEKSPRKFQTVNEWCKNNIVFNGKGLCFKDIVTADYNTLERVKDLLKDKKRQPSHLKHYLTVTLYENHLDRKAVYDALGIKVCPYCNRSYVSYIKEHQAFQFDHFFNKSDYPILSVSLYNLIPCCSSCNTYKGTNDFSYSPHNPLYESADMLGVFGYDILGVRYMDSNEDLTIHFYSTEILNGNNSILNFDDMYKNHIEIIREIIRKRIIYSEDYIQDLQNQFKYICENKEEVLRLLYGIPINDSEYNNLVLGKLKADIYKETEFLKYFEKTE